MHANEGEAGVSREDSLEQAQTTYEEVPYLSPRLPENIHFLHNWDFFFLLFDANSLCSNETFHKLLNGIKFRPVTLVDPKMEP